MTLQDASIKQVDDLTNELKTKKRRVILVHMTGYGKFGRSKTNPTELIARSFSKNFHYSGEYDIQLASVDVLKVCSQGVIRVLLQLYKQAGFALSAEGDYLREIGFDFSKQVPAKEDLLYHEDLNVVIEPGKEYIHLFFHMGLNGNLDREVNFEVHPVNYASYGIPDESGFNFNEPIIKKNSPLYPTVYPEIDKAALQNGKEDFISRLIQPPISFNPNISIGNIPMHQSLNAGRFTCNFLYYHSSLISRIYGQKPDKSYAVFIHIPDNHYISTDEGIQFMNTLIGMLAEQIAQNAP
ncbi:MAG: hypothetical protein EZS28_007007 [Streblomastix strix]|uniref:Pyrrolidone-carboxylate peptidase n=1 Tax=Streblomastix strix TaxID=222440 RepID=A0A5J4WQU4_9EUKA|nr:MAG: hypothetical protein EZS28_007007 [Streblomastix strix]